MDYLQFYYNLYAAELQRQQELERALTLPTGVLTLLAGVLGIYARALAESEVLDGATSLLGILVLLAVLAFLKAVANLSLAYHGKHEYRRLPYATDIEIARREMPIGLWADREEEKEIFDEEMIEQLASAQQRNAYTNESREQYLNEAKEALIYVLVLTLLGAIPYFLRILLASPTV